MSGPKRIQRQRTKGWRMPEGAVYVGRPTRWGNPFRGPGPAAYYSVPAGRGGGVVSDPERAVDFYRRWMAGEIFDVELQTYTDSGLSRPTPVSSPPSDLDVHAHLGGLDLACWCPLDQPCHADVLLELANGSDR